MKETVILDGIQYDLNGIEKDCWIRLLNASINAKNPLHNAVVANGNQQGVNVRTVVLRRVDTEQKTLTFHTDIRSGKWRELQENPALSYLFYHPTGRIQMRLAGTVSLHHDDAVADAAWERTGLGSRKIYCGETGPSTPSHFPVSGLPPALEKADPTPEESETGRKNFGVVVTQVTWMEWLWLNNAGHRRASFHYNDAQQFEAGWLIP